ncbi:hypothetical protein [Blastococcus litoris]|nr:hypothetical protein [Blastococcus litoris]
MSKDEKQEKKPYTVVDAAVDVGKVVVVAPVWWLLDVTVGWMLDA